MAVNTLKSTYSHYPNSCDTSATSAAEYPLSNWNLRDARAAVPIRWVVAARSLGELGDPVRQAGDLAARRVAMHHALLRRAHDYRRRVLECRKRRSAVAGGNRLLDLA